MRRRSVEPRRVIFIGVEGKSDQAFARFLGHCCQEAGLHLHKVWPEYSKQLTADQLIQRFALSDVQRAAQCDSELQRLLKVLGL